MKKLNLLILLLVLVVAGSQTAMAQMTIDQLKTERDAKKDQIKALQDEIDGIETEIATFPGWKFGAFGTVGANLSQFSNWYSRETPNVATGNIGITFNGLANLDREKFFWRNGLNLNLGWNQFDDKDDPDDDSEYKPATDVFKLTSLFGYKLSDKIALSAMAEYRTTFLSNFNDPGYLELGVGATWTPFENFIAVFHPLTYNFVFAKEDAIYESSLGCKIVADYSRELPMGISWSSNLSAFLSYTDFTNNSNWTWVNGLGVNIFKGLGLGFEFGLRKNYQESVGNAYKVWEENPVEDEPTFDNTDNDLQTYWLLGLSYNF